jgi:beta-lactam-binding protein with PASTA domain
LNLSIKERVKPLLGPIMFISSALLVFFFSAFLVIVFRTKVSQYVNMPDLLGRTYVEVHNELMRLRLKVKIEEENFPDKIDGLVLQQSIPAGKKIEAGSKLSVVVNVAVNKVSVPNVVGLHLDNAKSKLQKVLTGDSYIELEIGGVTYIPARDGLQPDTVIQQIPEAGKITTSKEKIYLLVTEPDIKKQSSGLNQPTQWVDMYFPIVASALNYQKKKWKVEKLSKTQDKKENGLIESFQERNGVYLFTVKYIPSQRRTESGLEVIEYEIGSDSAYSAKLEVLSKPKKNLDQVEYVEEVLRGSASEEKKENEVIILQEPTPYTQGEKLTLVFYRYGNVKVEVMDESGKTPKGFTFSSEL